MDQEVVIEKKAEKMSTRRKAKLFDEFVSKLAPFAQSDRVIQGIGGRIENEEIFNSDYEVVFNEFLGLLTNEEICEILMKILPTCLEQDLGAEKVTIKW